MNVRWNERALRKHRQQERTGRVKARLAGRTVGDVALGIPVLSHQQLCRLEALVGLVKRLNEDLTANLEMLGKALDLLRPGGHADGWADVYVIERAPNVLVAQVTHRRVKTPQAPTGDHRQARRFSHGYAARAR